MYLADDFTDSLLIYCDWLEDNEQLELAIEIRQELQECIFLHEFQDIHYAHQVGCFYDMFFEARMHEMVGSSAERADNQDGVGSANSIVIDFGWNKRVGTIWF